MGFMDKVKAQATSLAEKAQEQAKAGQEKLSTMQAKKQADALLLELGGITYAERVGRDSGSGEARAVVLVERLQAFEAEHGQVQITPAEPPPGDSGSYVPSGAGPAAATDASATPSPASMPTQGGGIPTAVPGGAEVPTVPTGNSGGGIPTANPGGGIPTANPGGGIPSGTTGDDAAPSSQSAPPGA